MGLCLALGVLAAMHVATHFALTTDTDRLLSSKLPWRQKQAAFQALFQPLGDPIVIVVDGRTAELAEAAAAKLQARLKTRGDLFRSVQRPDSGFFARNGLLFESKQEVHADLAQLVDGQPFLGPLAADPSLRGLMDALSTALQGVATGQASLTQLSRPIGALNQTLSDLNAGRPAVFSWRGLISSRSAGGELRRLVLAVPVLNFDQLRPGSRPSAFIRSTARALGLDPAHGVRIRLTGSAPIDDDEFGTLSEGAGLIGALAVSAIVAMLWFAVRSPRLIGAILITMLIGLVWATSLGLLIFHRFNLISVAFIPLFVGLGIDFSIQISVRFQAEQSGRPITSEGTRAALIETVSGMGRSLILAASAIAAGFLSFAPTAYLGVSQLGVIAGLGLFLALALNLTFLPALIQILSPPARGRSGSGITLAALDHFILAHRRWVVGGAVLAGLACAALIPWLRFDFNPLHLKNPKVESVATLLDLMHDPDQSPNTLEIVAPDIRRADALADRIAKLPEVRQVRTASSFVPEDQPDKLSAIADASALMDITLNPLMVAPAPTDIEVAQSLARTASGLRAVSQGVAGPAASSARTLASHLETLAQGAPGDRQRAQEVLLQGLGVTLDQTRTALQAAPVTLASLPATILSDWIAPDGRARVSVTPKGDSNDNRVLERFITAVTKVAPDAVGSPIQSRESARTVSSAFLEAGVLSFLAITVLLFAVLRSVRDVAITMAPIVLTGLLTLGTCVLIGQSLNFANIIALPLLFGIGVAFHIYFVLAWRSGGSHLLQSSLTHAIFFSALATATGFGSLWASSHPGTASMGELLMISLIWTLVSALLFQPALMGPPRPRAP